MGLGTLREKQLVRWRDRLLELKGKLPDGDWHMIELATGFMDKQSDRVLWKAIENGELVFISQEDEQAENKTKNMMAMLSENARIGSKNKTDNPKWNEAVHRYRYVTATKGLSKSRTESKASEVWKNTGWPTKRPGYSTVQMWRAKTIGKSDPVAALVEKSSRKGRHGDRYLPEVMDVCRDIRDLYYLKSNPRITLAKASEMAQDKIVLINATRPKCNALAKPGRRVMQKVIDEKPKADVIAARYGADVAMRMMRTSLGGVKVNAPLDRVELDHTTLAIILLDEDFEPWGRANMTLAVDAHTPCIVGAYWGAEVPSIVSLARCIRNSVQPKFALLEKYEQIQGDWPCFGLAKTYALDNGFSEHALALQQACSEMGGATAEFCRRAAPWFKPFVERHFRELDLDLLQTLPGATMENIMTRTDFDPAKDIVLRKSTFDRILMLWIVDIHLRTPRVSLGGKSPVDVWRRDIVKTEQFVPTRLTLLERLFLRDVDERTLDHEGVEYDCLIYNSVEMGVLRSQLGPVLRVTIRVSDEDLGHIFVGVPGHDIWIRVPCLDMDYAVGMTRWQHDKCKKMKRLVQNEDEEISLAQARKKILDEIEQETKKLKNSRRKKRSRFKEKDPQKESYRQSSKTPDLHSELSVVVEEDDAFDENDSDASPMESIIIARSSE